MENDADNRRDRKSSKFKVKSCFDSLSKGNDTEFPFSLSIWGAWMLRAGLRQHVEFARKEYESGESEPYETWMRITDAIREAEKLRDWFRQVEPDYLERDIHEMDALVKELAAEAEALPPAFGTDESSSDSSDGSASEFDWDDLFG